MPKVGVVAFPTPAEELVVLAQVNRDNIHANVQLDLLTRVQVQTIQMATKEDTTLELIMQQMMKGWPENG